MNPGDSTNIRIGIVLTLSGLFGFLLGSVGHGTWQLAVESAQVLAGLVPYPHENPFYMHHTKLWSVLHQLCVPLIWLGISERTLSFLFSGIMGMLSFQAASLLVLTLSGDSFVALAAPFLIQFTHATRYCAIYPVLLMATSNTHGAIGLSLAVLILTLIANHRYKVGMLLLAVSPAVHLSLGLLCWIIVFLCLLWDTVNTRQHLRDITKGFVIGATLTIISLAIHITWYFDVPSASSDVMRKYLYPFLTNWDSHRVPVAWKNQGLQLNGAALLIRASWLIKCRKSLDPKSGFLLRCLVVSAVFGIGFAILSQLSLESLPPVFLIMMPARILELNVLTFVPLLLGLASRHRCSFVYQLLSAAFVVCLIFTRAAPWKVMLLFGFVIMLTPWIFKELKENQKPATVLRSVTVVFLIWTVLQNMVDVDRFHNEPEEWNLFALSSTSDRNLFEAASKGKGMLLTCTDLHLIQLRTRRPVLLDGGQLDLLPYTYEAGPELERILREVYGVDFFHPPEEAKRTARIRVNASKSLWETRNVSEWKRIGSEFHFTEIMTYADWKLQLPTITRSQNLALYRIP